MDARSGRLARGACNTRLVRRLFAERAPVLSGALPEIFDAYHLGNGAPMLDDTLTAQVREFAHTCPELPLTCDEFLGLLQDICTDAPVDVSDASMAHSDSLQSVFSTRTDVSLDTTQSFDDADASIHVKLARSGASLERIYHEYDALLEHTHVRESQLEEQVRAFHRRAAEATSQKDRLAKYAESTEQRLAALESELHKEHEKRTDALTAECREHMSKIYALHERCEEYAAQAGSLRETAGTQSEVIRRLERTIELLENALEDAERVENERGTNLYMSESLEIERSLAEIEVLDSDTATSAPPSWPDIPETLADALRGAENVEHHAAEVQAGPSFMSQGTETCCTRREFASAGVQAGYFTSIGTQTGNSTVPAGVQAAPMRSSASAQAACVTASAEVQATPIRANAGAQAAYETVLAGVQAAPKWASAGAQATGERVPASVQAAPQRVSASAQATGEYILAGIQAAPTRASVGAQASGETVPAGIQAAPKRASAGTQAENEAVLAGVQAAPRRASVAAQAASDAACASVQAAPKRVCTGTQATCNSASTDTNTSPWKVGAGVQTQVRSTFDHARLRTDAHTQTEPHIHEPETRVITTPLPHTACVGTQTDDIPSELQIHAFYHAQHTDAQSFINVIMHMTSLILSLLFGFWAGVWLRHMSLSSSILPKLTRDDSTAWFDMYLG